MFSVDSVALKKSKSLCFVSKEKFLKSDGLWKWEWRYVFSGDSLNKNIPSACVRVCVCACVRVFMYK